MIKIKQVDPCYVKEHLGSKNIFRICVFDDTKKTADTQHFSCRMKQLSALSIEDVFNKFDEDLFAFVEVTNE